MKKNARLYYERIRFFVHATKLERKLLKKDALMENEFLRLFDRMHKLECTLMEMQLLKKHSKLVNSYVSEVESLSIEIPQNEMDELNQKMKEKFPFLNIPS